MAKYWLMPNDMDKVTAYNAHLATQLVLYKDYDLDKPEIHIAYNDSRTLMGGDLWVNDMKFVVSQPHYLHGLIRHS